MLSCLSLQHGEPPNVVKLQKNHGCQSIKLKRADFACMTAIDDKRII